MSEDYYQRALALIEAERRAYQRALLTQSPQDWVALGRASKRLTTHENSFRQ